MLQTFHNYFTLFFENNYFTLNEVNFRNFENANNKSFNIHKFHFQ